MSEGRRGEGEKRRKSGGRPLDVSFVVRKTHTVHKNTERGGEEEE
jgi:hypothetical protein